MPANPLRTCLLCLLFLASAPQVVQAVETARVKYKDATAFASFREESPCGFTEVVVFASSSATKEGGGPSIPQQMATVTVLKWDTCQQAATLVAVGDAPVSDFRVDPNLQTATLRCVIPVYDFVSDRFFDVAVDLAWNATGPQTVVTEPGHIGDPPIIVSSQAQARTRTARAAGSVREGATNFITLPSVEGSIQWVQIGELTITRSQ